jgi:hypothetical protein
MGRIRRMDTAARLALAVRATVARIRFEEAKVLDPATPLGDEAVETAQALARAWRGGPRDVLEWIGCTDEEYRQAVEVALSEGHESA